MIVSNGLGQLRYSFRGKDGIPGLGEGSFATGGSHYIAGGDTLSARNTPINIAHGSPHGDEVNLRITVRALTGFGLRNINMYWTGSGIGTFLMDNNPTSVLYGVTTDRYPPSTDTTEHEDDLASLVWTGVADNDAALGGGVQPISNFFNGTPDTDLDHEYTFALNWDLFDVGQTFAFRLRHGAALLSLGYQNIPLITIVAPPERSYSFITENPLASVLTADPVARVLSEDPSMAILARDPVARVLSENPSMDIITRRIQ